MTDREQFEAAFMPDSKDGKYWLRRSQNGEYLNPSTQSAWNGWKLARASQPAPELPAELFDGYAVYKALSKEAGKRTSYENVADLLDALAKVMSAAPSAGGKNGGEHG